MAKSIAWIAMAIIGLTLLGLWIFARGSKAADTISPPAEGTYIVLREEVEFVHMASGGNVVQVRLHGPVEGTRTIRLISGMGKPPRRETKTASYKLVITHDPQGGVTYHIDGEGDGKDLGLLLSGLSQDFEREIGAYLASYGQVEGH